MGPFLPRTRHFIHRRAKLQIQIQFGVQVHIKRIAIEIDRENT